MFGYIRVAAAVPATRVGDVSSNTAEILKKIKAASRRGADLILFPSFPEAHIPARIFSSSLHL